MNHRRAKKLLNQRLESFRKMGYERLKQLAEKESKRGEILDDPILYYYQIQVFWDGKRGGNIRVMGNIGDGSFMCAISPLVEGFIITKDGEFIGE